MAVSTLPFVIRWVVLAVACLTGLGLPAPASAASADAAPALAFSSGCCVASPGAIALLRTDWTTRTVASRRGPVVAGPTWAPDRGTLAYAVSTTAGVEIRTVGRDGRGDRLLAALSGFSAFDIAWSADGRWLAVEAVRGGVVWGVPHVTELLVLGVGGDVVVPLGPGSSPDWSPTGATVAFSLGGGISTFDVSASSTGAPRRVTPASVLAGAPDWSPDGRSLTFLGWDIDAEAAADRGEVWTIRADGSGARGLGVRSWEAPAWSPGGKWIAYTDGALRLVSPSGRTRRTVARDATAFGEPAWTANGRWLAYLTDAGPGGRTGITVVRSDGTQRRDVAVADGRPGFAFAP